MSETIEWHLTPNQSHRLATARAAFLRVSVWRAGKACERLLANGRLASPVKFAGMSKRRLAEEFALGFLAEFTGQQLRDAIAAEGVLSRRAGEEGSGS